MKVMSEGVESLGAQGYIESTNIPVMMRDAQVISLQKALFLSVIGDSNMGRHNECSLP